MVSAVTPSILAISPMVYVLYIFPNPQTILDFCYYFIILFDKI